jgi:putative phosphoribosyl transferase
MWHRWGGQEGAIQFRDRTEAGRALGRRLRGSVGPDLVVVGLPRGGVPVAAEVADALDAPLDVVVVRKVGVPQQPELAMGAVGEDGVTVVNQPVVMSGRIPARTFEHAAERARGEMEQRLAVLRGTRPPERVAGRTVVLVDDGLATGSTAEAAVRVLRARGAARIVLAVPVAPPDAVARLERLADAVVCLESPEWFGSVGSWYTSFEPVPDEEVRRLLTGARASSGGETTDVVEASVLVTAAGVALPGTLSVPADPLGLVVFAHGSGSSAASPRNVAVAASLAGAGLATLLFDLLTEAEGRRREAVFDVALLAGRLVAGTRWAAGRTEVGRLPVGYFGASTGAAAALVAAADLGDDVRAVVSRGGRPDLAGDRLPDVTAPTLLVVGGRDTQVLRLNERARQLLRCESRLEVVPGATHLFEEPGTLERVAELARDWFLGHLPLRPGTVSRA